MKHNNSNQSISAKKFVNMPIPTGAVPAGNSNIKKHVDAISVGGISKKNYLSPYS
jgi:hypothetical protein